MFLQMGKLTSVMFKILLLIYSLFEQQSELFLGILGDRGVVWLYVSLGNFMMFIQSFKQVMHMPLEYNSSLLTYKVLR